MKKITTFILTLVCSISITIAQDTIAGWTFPTGTISDKNPDLGIPQNSGMIISTQGGTSAIDFSKNGYTTKAAQATGWDNGANQKWWQIELNTTGYKNLKLNSKLTSGGNNPGPRDFKVQYKTTSSGSFVDIPNSIISTANNWTSGVIDNISIPDECNNQENVIIRWLMTSDISSSPPALVLPTGISKIDDILITGTSTATSIAEINTENNFKIFPIPSANNLFIETTSVSSNFSYEIISMNGSIVKSGSFSDNENLHSINVNDINCGFYFIRLTINTATVVKKIIIS